MRMRLLIAAAVVVAAACGDSSTGTSTSTNKTVDIFTIGDIFSPTFATLSVGDTARWNFAGGSDGLGHNVRFNPRITGSPTDINVFKTGTQFRVFTTKGTFKYDCDVHPGMKAEITVE
ncbi:MAG TPA: plastocyanin/azurin family copper-binding protein [Gemmatimonadaceae bacterium]